MKAESPRSRPKKSLGQNFLVDGTVAPRIVEESGIDGSFGVIEIGPGRGALTGELLKAAKKVVAVELDGGLIPQLEKKFGATGRLVLLHADILKVDIAELIDREFAGMRVAVMGNLPYYITSPIIMGLLERRLAIETIVAMVQREAARRLCAEPKSRDTGAVSIAVRYYSEPRVLFDVPPDSFRPAPKVTSSVIKLDVLKTPSVSPSDERAMFAAVRAAFSQRRKSAVNAIAAGLGIEKRRVADAFASLSLDPMSRAENLSAGDYAALSGLLADAAASKGI